MKIAILGFGREGQSILRFLLKTRIYADKNPEIWILDRNPKITTSQVVNVKFQTGKNYLKNLEQFNIVFRSPGVPYNLPEIQKAIKKGVKFSSATKLFFQESQKNPGIKIIGITGTKGKGTTSTLLYKILKASGKNVHLAGNIGKSVIELLPRLSAFARHSGLRRTSPLRTATAGCHPRKSASIFIILELSSFQLQDLNQSPDIAVVLDIFPDHLDAHKNLSEYVNAKANIAKWQKKTDKIFYFADNRYSKWIASKSPAKKHPIYSRHSHTFADLHYVLKIPGEHNIKNAVMAASVALSLGCPKNKILNTIKKFKGNEHRLELIRSIRVYPLLKNNNPRLSASIKFYNDSASTNPQTAAAAIKAFKEPKILIAGGKDKNLNYSPLAKALKNSNTKLVILFGENKEKIKEAIKNSKTPIKLKKNLETVTKTAYRVAKKTLKSKVNSQWSMVSIIFSPASASFDMFKDYKDRGKEFKEIVKKLK